MTEPGPPLTDESLGRPVPIPDELSKYFWTGAAEHRLVIQRCVSCGKYIHLPKVICPFCLSFDTTHTDVSGLGRLYSFTVAEHPFHPGLPVPYILANVELDEQPGLRIVSNLTDCDLGEASVGARVEAWFDEVAPGIVLPQFRLARR